VNVPRRPSSLLLERARETVRVAISRQKVRVKETLKTFLQPRVLL
jgi:hypothetical protein